MKTYEMYIHKKPMKKKQDKYGVRTLMEAGSAGEAKLKVQEKFGDGYIIGKVTEYFDV
jgi:hypothetical protein